MQCRRDEIADGATFRDELVLRERIGFKAREQISAKGVEALHLAPSLPELSLPIGVLQS